MALTTGMRYSEIMGLRWDDIDISEQMIKLKTSKNGRPRHVPLVGKALDLVVKMAMHRKKVSGLVLRS